jgi:nucleoside-diphosphate-sugar epimerase
MDKEPSITRDEVATLTVDGSFNHARASQELGYRPQVDYGEGLRRTLDWLQETRFCCFGRSRSAFACGKNSVAGLRKE